MTVPTMAEAGLAGLELSQNFGVAVRSGTPKEVVERLNKEINAILAIDEVKNFILGQGAIAQQKHAGTMGYFYAAKKEVRRARASCWNCEDHVGSYAGFSVTRRSVGMAFRHLDDLPDPPWAGKELLAQQIVEPTVAASV